MMSSFATHPGYLSSNSLALWNVNCILNQKDSRWLQLEVCREFQRNRCSRSDAECKFAHPTTNVEVQNGKVTACYDSIKGRCNREKPPCKYFHPPQHLKDQLLINGRNHLALKNAIMTQMGLVSQQPQQQQQQPTQQQPAQQPLLPGQIQTVSSPYLTTLPGLPAAYASTAAAPFLPGAALNHQPTILHSTDLSPTSNAGTPSLTLFQQPQQQQLAAVAAQQQQQAKPRSDRIETLPNIVPYKRAASSDKSGHPIYHPSHHQSHAYQQALMHLQQPPFVPVAYTTPPTGIALPRYHWI
ncbi:uncharacterized protein mbl isoform X2 [Lepeophtheirus salmonis]|uniref:uncharacterized protein mbl isoform X2 n=1 Tax=Lepeophtheirus salmonis TaxID=72036 RepID=UPI001AEA8816|nr:protein muscleblind-like isoform X2 [Lepeophtheirus salmonis]